MKRAALLSLILCGLTSVVWAYEITGAKPIDKLEAEQAKAKQGKKLICIVYKGRDNTCPHCAAAAEVGVKAVRGTAETVVITEAQTKDAAIVAKLPEAVQKVLKHQSTNAYVSFNVFDADMKTLIASADRFSLENDKKKTKEFTTTIREAQKAVK